MADICGICAAGPGNYGSIYYVGAWRCDHCAGWEHDNADPLYLEHLNRGGPPKGHGKGMVPPDAARILKGMLTARTLKGMATPELTKRMLMARLESITSLVLPPLFPPPMMVMKKPARARLPKVMKKPAIPPKTTKKLGVTIVKK